MTVVTGTTVVFRNSDDVWHNVFSTSPAKRFNLGTYAKGVDKRLVLDKPGVVELLCNVHPEMSAFILVADTPHSRRRSNPAADTSWVACRKAPARLWRGTNP